MRHKYLSLAQLRDLGIDASQLPDSKALSLIYKVSDSLDQLTRQFFQPELLIYAASGTNSPVVHHKDLIPILEVEDLSVDYNKTRTNYFDWRTRVFGRNLTVENLLDLTAFELSPDSGFRLLKVLSGNFPIGVGNVIITGAFGWLEDRRKFQTTLASDLSAGDTVVSLTEVINSSGWIDVGDFVVVELASATEDRPALLYVDIVQEISGSDLTVDEVIGGPGLPISAGATVRSFGRFPIALTEVMEALVLRAWEDDPNNPNDDPDEDRLLSERVDNYSYQYESKSVKYSRFGGLGAITGSVRLDRIIQDYTQPVYVGFA